MVVETLSPVRVPIEPTAQGDDDEDPEAADNQDAEEAAE
jgi:hypothetical protein